MDSEIKVLLLALENPDRMQVLDIIDERCSLLL